MKNSADVELPIGGMTCAACARTVERQLASSPGVEKASVNFATKIASVSYNPRQTGVADLVAAVEDVGYQVQAGSQEIAAASEARELRQRLLAGAAFAIPVFILGMLERAPLVQFVLTLPVLFYAGRSFFADAWSALKHRSANMNTLIALGTGAAFLYSTFAVATGRRDVYFEAAAVIVLAAVQHRAPDSQ